MEMFDLLRYVGALLLVLALVGLAVPESQTPNPPEGSLSSKR